MKAILRHVWPLSIRAQLTIGYAFVFILSLLIILGSSYSLVRNMFFHNEYVQYNLTTDLQIQRIEGLITYPDGKITIGNIDSMLGAGAKMIPSSSDAPSAAVVARIVDVNGAVLYATPNFTIVHPPGETMSYPLKGITWTGALSAFSTNKHIEYLGDFNFHSVPLINNGHIVGVLQVGVAMPSMGNVFFLIGFFVIMITCIVLGILFSYLLASRAFRPIRKLTAMARAINAGDLSQRVPVPAARDDIFRLAVTFNEMLARLEAGFKQQQQFIADASHELRTPIAVIRSMTDSEIVGVPSTTEYAEILHNVNSETVRLSDLLSSMLLLARADEHSLTLDCSDVRLDHIILDIIDSMEIHASEHGLQVVDEHVDVVTLSVDITKIIQVLMELVENAIKYTPNGGTIAISVIQHIMFAHIIVKDTGIGIATADLPHIFERFYRADRGRSRIDGSSGLGLAIAETIIHAHRGTIEVESIVGKGSTFTIILPLH